MSTLSFIDDDFPAAQAFVASLNRKIVRLRFSGVGEWKPNHIALAVRDGQVVAMADCVLSDEESGANASLLARPGFGAYAISALLRLKKRVAAEHWLSTLREPTPATIAISRRYFDETCDQTAWELSSGLIRQHGQSGVLQAAPLIASAKFLRLHSIPPLKELDGASKNQVLNVALDLGRGLLHSPNGYPLGGPELLSLVFDLADVPMRVRQDVSRITLFLAAAQMGHNVDPNVVKKYFKQDSMSIFMAAVKRAVSLDLDSVGIFAIKPHAQELRSSP